MHVSPEGPNSPYDADKDSFSDQERFLKFVLASRLFDPVSGARRDWVTMADEATDEEVADAIAALEEGQP